MKPMTNTLMWLALFSLAMGYMESAVVVYLREIYYPDGFKFPLIPIEPRIGLIELLREAATIIMLLGIGILSAQSASLRFAFFIFCFAIWDLFYYIFLKLLIDWPESLLTWDILFLIPVPWVGPVITPCIVSVTMMILALSIVYFHEKGISTKLAVTEWIVLSTGSLVVILAFVWDYLSFIRRANIVSKSYSLVEKKYLFDEIANYVPVDFNWSLFLTGEALILAGILIYVRRKMEMINDR
jgi:hypothetical protein